MKFEDHRQFFRTAGKSFCFTGIFLALTIGSSFGQNPVPAFPGAEGFGQFATGGRGGEIYHVTTLADTGPGSFRDAVSRPHRTIVFDVGGLISITRRITVAPNITIAGQTAPGDGVVIYGNGISFSGANHTIVRYLRFRMGINGDSGKDAVTIASGHDMIFDHVSVSWGRDENFSISGPVTNVTIQDSIIAQGLQPHSCGGLIQTDGGVSILRSLYIDNHTRNPKVKGRNQFINNVIYNWGGGGGYILGDSEGPSRANVLNNYFINGPSTSASAFSRGNLNFHLYAALNFQDANRNGVLDGAPIPSAAYGTVDWQEKPYDYPPVTALTPLEAWQRVVSRAGASQHRDEVDQRLITELRSAGTLGQTIRRETDPPMNGVGTIRGGSTATDTDQDGMPDDWESALGLDPKNPDDRNRSTDGGYTRLEQYLNWLAAPHATAIRNHPVEVDLRPFANGFDQPHFEISTPANCTVRLLTDGHTARVEPGKDFVGLARFDLVSDAIKKVETVSVLVLPDVSKESAR